MSTSMPARATIAIFASDRGPGDAERASIMAQAGNYFARRGARLICLADGDVVPVPLITSARTSGGEVVVVGGPGLVLPSALGAIPVETFATSTERMKRVAELAGAFVGLPGSFASASSLYSTWVQAGGGAGGKPVVLYNRNNAFEVLRGFAADVLAHSVSGHERVVQFADSIEDVWNRLARLMPELR